MDAFMPGMRTGNFAPCRAGGFVGNHLIHSSFIPAKSVSSRTMTVALTTRSSEVPAALRMADTFSRHCRVCSWIVSPTIFPVTGSCGPVPETNTRPAARTAWLYIGGGVGALGVRMISFAINFSNAEWATRARTFPLILPLEDGWPTQARVWLEWGCLAPLNSLIPSGGRWPSLSAAFTLRGCPALVAPFCDRAGILISCSETHRESRDGKRRQRLQFVCSKLCECPVRRQYSPANIPPT